MADINYISPSSIMPQLGQVNIPGLAGAMLANQERDYRDTMDLQKFLSGVGAQKSQIGLEELIRDLPKNELNRQRDMQNAGLDLMYNPSTREYENRDRARKDITGNALLPSAIDAGISENQKKVNTNNLDQVNTRLAHVIAMRDMLEDDDPTSLQRVLTHAQSVGMKESDPIYQHLAKSSNPTTLRERLSAMEKSLHSQKDSNYVSLYGKDLQAEMQDYKNQLLERITGMKLGSAERNTDATNQARIEVARIKAQTDSLRIAQRSANQNIEQRITALRAQGTPEAIKEAEELASLKIKIAGARDAKTAAQLITMMQLGQMPESERKPEKMMQMYMQNLEKLNNVERVLTERYSGVPATGGSTSMGATTRGLPNVNATPTAPGLHTTPPSPQDAEIEDPRLGDINDPFGTSPTLPHRIAPGAAAVERDLRGAMGSNVPGDINLNPNLPTLANPGGAIPPSQPQAAPTTRNEIDKRFEEFMKNRKRNEVPR